jgi:hypothetical protein
MITDYIINSILKFGVWCRLIELTPPKPKPVEKVPGFTGAPAIPKCPLCGERMNSLIASTDVRGKKENVTAWMCWCTATVVTNV